MNVTPLARFVSIAGLIAAVTAGARATRVPAPRAPAEARFFLQFSDPQFGMYTADSSFVQETANFEFVIATANRLRPAFVVVTGDLINKPGDPVQGAEYQRIAARLAPAIPIHNVPGNHDVGNVPTPASVAAYVRRFGPDHYAFTSGDLTGIVINSSLIKAPDSVPREFAEQERWLEQELARAQRAGARHIVVFQHHPWFLTAANEPDQYFNLPLAVRPRYLALFRKYGVHVVFAGHYHQNALARDGDLEMVTTGPVGKPSGTAKSGIRIVMVTDTGITHRYYELGEMPKEVVSRKP